jgi:hypothetical protein
VILSDLPAPSAGPPLTLAGPPVPPAHRIYFYPSDEWEEFIREWAQGLDEDYVQIKQLGGPGDQGIDVAAFKSEQGLEGPWDCFQGKHYARELRPADAWAEMLKVFLHVDAGDYVLPDTYQFLAPKGCGGTLNRLLSTPTKLRIEFLAALDAGGPLVKDVECDVLGRVRDLAMATDFAMFKSVELHDALQTHATTRYHLGRFGAPALSRSPVDDPPEELGAHETNYVGELRKVYAEACDEDLSDVSTLAAHPEFGEHFKRQRYSFYSAEALRMDVRDAVPEGTFERLQDDVLAGVIETVDAEQGSGMARLTAALTHATLLDLSAHPLVSLARPNDRKGICHQLANNSRVTWSVEQGS